MDKQIAEKAKQAKSVAELSRMAKQEGIALSDSQAEKVYQRFHSENQELSDEELNNVSGGGCSSAKELGAKYQKVNPGSIGGGFVWSYGQISRTDGLRHCENCHWADSAEDVSSDQPYSLPIAGTSYFCEKRPL